ncbi:MAG: GAF domain-containing protein [Thermodesulfobacteriota bacterium]|nr:GAF domain-containing protein [Thermodesulfobacteriota bacterium]
MEKKQDHGKTSQKYQHACVELVYDIARTEYKKPHPLLKTLFYDVTALYSGKWPSHEACQVGYHSLEHAMDVTLATARMAAGWSRLEEHRRFSEDLFLSGIAAALFHDAGYMKNKGDNEGNGGKYTFSHVRRSMELARSYLSEKGWPEWAVTLVPRIISLTEFNKKTEMEGLFDDEIEEVMARIVATADLVAQMADVNYIRRIHDLFSEFKEAYEFESHEILEKRGVRIFKSAGEMIDGTMDFFENFVLPRLKMLGRMDQYLIAFFGHGRNPYLENIAANLSGYIMDTRVQGQRLGEILEDLGVVTSDQINTALTRQQKRAPSNSRKGEITAVGSRLLNWINKHNISSCLGGILIEMKAIDPEILRKGLLTQMLPPALTGKIKKDELFILLQISMLLQNNQYESWLFKQILEMTNQLLQCDASSLFLAGADISEMVVAVPTGPRKDSVRGKSVPVDKGLCGWVFRHCRPVAVADVLLDTRFSDDLDRQIDFTTQSILAIPIQVNGKCVGVLEGLNKKNGVFTSHDMNLLTVLGVMISGFLASFLKMTEQ